MDRDGLISFLEFQLDLERGELRRNGAPVKVEPQVLDLIGFFARHPGQLVSRDELVEAVWGGRFISDSAISSRINAARAALGDDGTAQRLIKTVPRRGFRFEAAVGKPATTKPETLPDKPSVAVLPFENLSGDPEQSYFSDGITDDIITDLSRYDELFVGARHSSFAYSDDAATGAKIAEELGVHYIVDGSVRRAGDRIRVSVHLTDPWAGRQLWAERYDRKLTDIFEVQDEITSLIVNTLAGEISRQHFKRSLNKTADAVTAYDHVLRALDYGWKHDPEGHRKAIEEARRALALDPHQARAHAVISWANLHFYINALTDDGNAAMQRCASAAVAAVDADDREPWAHIVLGWVYQFRDRNTQRALAELDRAVALNPSNVFFRSLRAFSLPYAGQSERAISELGSAMQHYPHFPILYHVHYARALFNLGRYAKALPHLERVRAAQTRHPLALALTAACYAANGQMEEARATAAEVRRASERFTITHAAQVLPYELEEDRERFLTMFARAFQPE
ncbi:MAG: winged helix-turn-helix domain-containing protein [Rhodobacter sp.]|nr:winged helix-turn-helix domain-containing protein [Rhodobacter sp.]